MKPLTTDEVISLATTVLLDANPFDTRYEFTQTQLVSFAHKIAAIVALEDPFVRDLTMLLGKAAYTLKRTAPGHPLAIEVARKATDYLRCHGLEGSPLRADNGGPVSVTLNA